MWHAAKVLSGPSPEPVTLAMARTQCRVDATDTTYDSDLNRMIAAARAHVEVYCSIRLGAQTIEVECDSFADMARLSEAPVASVTSIAYTDLAGETQTLSTDVYERRSSGYEASVILKDGQSWPAIKRGSRIKMTAVVGVDPVPADIVEAMLLKIAERFFGREDGKQEDWTALDALLCNHRRYP